jgi:hypothetical protein
LVQFILIHATEQTSTVETWPQILWIEQVFDLEKLPVISGFDASNLSVYFTNQPFKLCVQIHALAVGVEADEYHGRSMHHHDVMVSVRFVFTIVPTVRMLVGLDTQQGGADDKPMVDASPHRTLAVASFHRLVMDEAFKVIVDRFPHREFLRLVVVDLALRMTRKQVLVAGRAVAIVVLFTSSRVRPVNTVGASESSAVTNAPVCISLSTLQAVLKDALFAFFTAMFYAFTWLSNSKIVTAVVSTSFESNVSTMLTTFA